MKITFVGDLLFVILVTGLILTSGKPDSAAGVLVWLVMGGTVLAVHALFTFNIFRRYIDQMAQREMARDEPYEKPKRHAMEISDDGELVEDAPTSSPLSNVIKSQKL